MGSPKRQDKITWKVAHIQIWSKKTKMFWSIWNLKKCTFNTKTDRNKKNMWFWTSQNLRLNDNKVLLEIFYTDNGVDFIILQTKYLNIYQTFVLFYRGSYVCHYFCSQITDKRNQRTFLICWATSFST